MCNEPLSYVIFNIVTYYYIVISTLNIEHPTSKLCYKIRLAESIEGYVNFKMTFLKGYGKMIVYMLKNVNF